MFRKMITTLSLLIMITALSACGFHDSDTKGDSTVNADIKHQPVHIKNHCIDHSNTFIQHFPKEKENALTLLN